MAQTKFDRYEGDNADNKLLKELLRRHEIDKAIMREKIAELETRIAHVESMPSDQTWNDLTKAVEAEINAIKYRAE